MADLEPYRKELALAREDLKSALARGTESAFSLAVRRRTTELMDEDLRVRPQDVLRYDNREERGFKGPTLWRVKSQEAASVPFSRRLLSPAEYNQKNEEYKQLIGRIRQRQALDKLFVDPFHGIAYLTQENDQVVNALTDIIYSLGEWVATHSSDEDFLKTPATVGLFRMFEERQELVAALRLAQLLPKDHRISRVPIERPAMVEIVEIAVSLIPVVGNAVAIFEAVSGRDLFGYDLDPVERAIIAAGVLVPVASRFVRGGRILYTAARMERLYGPGAARWSIALATGERLAADTKAIRTFKQADTLVKAHGQVDAQLAKDVVDTLERLSLRRASTVITPLPATVSGALKQLISRRAFLAELDELAIQRVIDKGPNINLMKGQLLEELLESRIAAWLRDPAGAAALGIQRLPAGVEFIPGHMIRDAAGRQITDGILARRGGGTLEILAVFEAKAGSGAARELKLASSSIGELSQAERAELRAYARDILRSRRIRAQRAGLPFPTKESEISDMLDDIEKEIVLSEKGGQVRRDFERLHENADGSLAKLMVGTEEITVRVSPTKTKIFGVLPKDVGIGTMEQDLRALGYDFEVLGMNVTEKEMVDLTQDVRILVEPP